MTRKELKDIIFECYVNHLREQDRLLKEDLDKETNMVYGKRENVEEGDESVLPDSTEQILSKFPTLKHCLVRLQSEDYMQFLAGIDWISPRPTQFRINLKNGQNFTLTWEGKDFKANISGKDYYLGQLTDYQRALQKLSLLYQEGPMGQSEEGGEGEAGADIGGGSSVGGGSGDFPGGLEGGGEIPAGGEEGNEEGGDEEEKDLSKDKVDFEADSEI